MLKAVKLETEFLTQARASGQEQGAIDVTTKSDEKDQNH
jgi:hypothetical protein